MFKYEVLRHVKHPKEAQRIAEGRGPHDQMPSRLWLNGSEPSRTRSASLRLIMNKLWFSQILHWLSFQVKLQTMMHLSKLAFASEETISYLLLDRLQFKRCMLGENDVCAGSYLCVNVPFPAVKCCRARKLHAMPLIKISIASTAASATIMLLTFNCIIPLNSIKSHQVKRGPITKKGAHLSRDLSGRSKSGVTKFKKTCPFRNNHVWERNYAKFVRTRVILAIFAHYWILKHFMLPTLLEWAHYAQGDFPACNFSDSATYQFAKYWNWPQEQWPRPSVDLSKCSMLVIYDTFWDVGNALEKFKTSRTSLLNFSQQPADSFTG